MTGFWKCLIQYIAQGHSTSWWVLIERRVYSKPYQWPMIEHFGKIIVAFNYFHKTLHPKSLRGLWICIGFYICQCSECSTIASMPRFWIFRVAQSLLVFINMTGFWICIGMQLGKGSEYFRIANMAGCDICKD